MDHMPWVLNELPRNQHSNPDIFGSPPVRKQRTRKSPKDLKLDTITERPIAHGQRSSPEHLRRDASTSTTDLGNGFTVDADGVKKVQKGQINALAKMLSALRRWGIVGNWTFFVCVQTWNQKKRKAGLSSLLWKRKKKGDLTQPVLIV
jgi:hypothetical protein